MVNISTPKNTNNNVTVSSPNTNNTVNTLNSVVFSEDLSQQWAVKLDGKVKNEDYSSKYYALQAKQTADNLELDAKAINELKPQLLEDFENYGASLVSTKENALNEISNATELSVVDINSTSTVAIGNINAVITSSTGQINAVATEQIELVASTANKAIEDIDTLRTNTINEVETHTEKSVETISNLANEIKDNSEQIINRLGLNLGDIVQKDHILSFEESEGLALLGTYVYKNGVAGSRYGYPDFYNKYLEEYQDSVPVEKPWTQPVLSANGALGGDSFAVSSNNAHSTYPVYQAFDGNASTNWLTNSYATSQFPVDLIVYNPVAIKISKISFTNRTSYASAPTAGNIYGSNDNSDYQLITSFTNNVTSISGNWDVSLQANKNFYKYYKIEFTNGVFQSDGNLGLSNVSITATLGEGAYYQNANGHKFYSISQKSYFDELFETTGEAWFYGIDTDNERIFLPRETGRYLVDKKEPTIADPTWYNLYSDGWCEQGGSTESSSGYATVVLLKNYKDINYHAIFAVSRTDGSDTPSYILIQNKTTTSFRARTSNPSANLSVPITWTASGYTDVETDLPKYKYMVVGNTTTEKAQTEVTEITTSENDTLPLFHNFYSKEDMTTTGAYVNASLGSWLSGNVYPTAYNELVNKLGTGNVKANTDEYTDYDCVVNQDDMTFRLPLKNGQEIMFATRVKGNGMTLGLTDGVINYGMREKNISSSGVIGGSTGSYGVNIGTINADGDINNSSGKSLGVTTDSTKSGIELDTENITIPDGWNLYYKVANAVTNLEILDVAKVMNAVNNLIPNNKNVWDGQWVVSKIELSKSSSASQTIDLSDYLPNDGYNYDVLFNIVGYCATEYYGCLGTDLIPISAGYLGCTLWTSTNSRHNANTFIMPVGSGRYATWASNGTWGTLMINVLGYRRIGSNS